VRETAPRTAGIQSRDPQVIEEIVREHAVTLLRRARVAGLPADAAEDAVQATFVTFLHRAHEFDGRAQVGAWLFGILIRKVAEARRDQTRDEAAEDIDAVMESRFDTSGRWVRPPRGPERDFARAETMRQLADCLGRLPHRQRLAFVLREVEELTPEEICKALEVSRNNLGVLLFRARHRLRECLEQKGFEGSIDAVV